MISVTCQGVNRLVNVDMIQYIEQQERGCFIVLVHGGVSADESLKEIHERIKTAKKEN